MPSVSNDVRHALLIAVQTYADTTLTNLGAPISDAEALRNVLEDKAVGNFRRVDLLRDPTADEARRAVEHFFTDCRPDDVLVFHFGGHAFRDDTSDKLYLALSDTEQVGNPHASALSGDFLLSVIEASPARRKLLILDCCHSGAFTLTRGVSGDAVVEARTADFDQGVESIVSRLPAPAVTVPATGTVVIGAARATEKAHESRAGLLTGAIVEGLSTGEAARPDRGVVSTDDLFEYVEKSLEGHPDQHPVRHERNKSGPFIVAENPRHTPSPLSAELLNLLKSRDPGDRMVAVARLTALVQSADSHVAGSAWQLLSMTADFDTDWDVRTHAEARVAQASLKSARTGIDFGTLTVGEGPRTRDIAVEGPPVADGWRVVGATDEIVVAERVGDRLQVSVDPVRVGPVDAAITVASAAGGATISVTARVVPAVAGALPPPPAPAPAPAPAPTRPPAAALAIPSPAPDPPTSAPTSDGEVIAAVAGLGAWSRRWVAAAAVVLAGVATTLVVGFWREPSWCMPQKELRILTTAQVRTAVEAAAVAFTRPEDGGCPSLHVTITATASDEPARKQLGDGWPTTDMTAGPQPDLWLPESSVQVEWLRATLAASKPVPRDRRLRVELPENWTSTAHSPIVLAVPGNPAGPAPRKALAWSDLATDRGFKNEPGQIVRANPASTSSGLLATHAMYAALGKADPRNAERMLTPGQGGDEADHLCLARQHHNPPDKAYLVAEKQFRDYNEGRPLGDGCPAAEQPLPSHRLAAVPLQGDPTAALDLPCVVLRGSTWSEEEQRDVAASDEEQQDMAGSFCEFLVGERGQQVLHEHGLGGRTGEAHPLPKTASTKLFERWTKARTPLRILLVMDVSGSMADPMPGTKTERIVVARKAAKDAVAGSVLGEKDEIGLWEFATKLKGDQDHRPLLNLQSGTPDHLEAMGQKLLSIPATKQDTGLHDTILAGIKRLRADQPVRPDGLVPINRLIVLTDGENDDQDSASVGAVGAELAKPGPEVLVSLIAAVGGNCSSFADLKKRGLACSDDSRAGLDVAFAQVLPPRD